MYFVFHSELNSPLSSNIGIETEIRIFIDISGTVIDTTFSS